MAKWIRQDERKMIAEAIALGADVPYVATLYGVTTRTVYTIMAEHGLKPNNDRIYALGRAAREKGMTLTDIKNWTRNSTSPEKRTAKDRRMEEVTAK